VSRWHARSRRSAWASRFLVTGTYNTDIITDAGTTDSRDFDGAYVRHHATMDRRGRLAMKYAARSPERFAAGLAKALDAKAPFVRRPVGPECPNAVESPIGYFQVLDSTS